MSFSSNNKLSYYTDKANIPNQDLVGETIEYFKNGKGARAFRPLELLNLLDKQFNFVKDNFRESEKVISHLKSLPLTDLEKHILLGLIIKWFGGYPFNEGTDFDEIWLATKKVIQKEFLSYPDQTPEKDFCKADYDKRNYLMKLGMAFTTSMNTGIPATEILNELHPHEAAPNLSYSFEGLFSEAVHKGMVRLKRNEYVANTITMSKYHVAFNIWLQTNKGWSYGNDLEYRKFLSIDIFQEFLLDYRGVETASIFYSGLSTEEAYNVFHDAFEKLRDKFRVKRKATKEDCKTFSKLKEGDIIAFDPPYNTSLEAYSLLTEYYSASYFELEKYKFYEKYKAWNALTIKAEISEIENFIYKAETENLSTASTSFNKWEEDKDEYVYLRFKSGFYQNLEIERYPIINAAGNREARVYGRYFLFYEYLIQELSKIQPVAPSETKEKEELKLEFVPKLFSELFRNVALLNDCLELLKTTDKPCIGDENNYIRNKGVFVVWFNVLESKKIFNCTFSNDAERAMTLNFNFQSLNVSASLFRQSNKRATENCKTYFENEIAALKH